MKNVCLCCISENHALDAWFKRAFGDEGDKKLLLLNKSAVWQMHLKSKRREFRMSLNDINNLSHAKWNYKYHIVLPIVISITQGFTSIPKARS